MMVSTSSSGGTRHKAAHFLVCLFCGCGVALAALAAAQPGCASGTSNITGRNGPIHAIAERRAGPQPESEWNGNRLWRKVGDSPATYIPSGYSASASRGPSAGKWIVDARDGKRLFAPNTSVGGLRPGVLEGEAINATNWQYGYFRPESRAAAKGSLPEMRKLPEPVIRGQ